MIFAIYDLVSAGKLKTFNNFTYTVTNWVFADTFMVTSVFMQRDIYHDDIIYFAHISFSSQEKNVLTKNINGITRELSSIMAYSTTATSDAVVKVYTDFTEMLRRSVNRIFYLIAFGMILYFVYKVTVHLIKL